MTSFLNRVFSVFKTKESNPKDITITVNVMGTNITVNSAEIHSTKEDVANLHDKRNRRYRRYDRLMRHKKIWAVLSYAKSLEAIFDSNNFYDLDNALLDYNNALARLNTPDLRPSENEMLCAFRFCDIQNHKGKCNHRLSENEKQNISNWSNYTLDYTKILDAVSKRFITYWDKVLGAYKKKHAYLRRLDYIINHLNEAKHRKGLSTMPQIEDYLNKVKIHYSDITSSLPDDSRSTSKETVKT